MAGFQDNPALFYTGALVPYTGPTVLYNYLCGPQHPHDTLYNGYNMAYSYNAMPYNTPIGSYGPYVGQYGYYPMASQTHPMGIYNAPVSPITPPNDPNGPYYGPIRHHNVSEGLHNQLGYDRYLNDRRVPIGASENQVSDWPEDDMSGTDSEPERLDTGERGTERHRDRRVKRLGESPIIR
jgi:hypothetical protein